MLANIELSIVGKGASDSGTRLTWIGTGFGPTIRLAGPNRATLRDFIVRGNSGGTDQQVDALVIEGAD